MPGPELQFLLTYGLDHHNLTPLLLDPVTIPTDFDHIHAVKLTAWTGEDDTSYNLGKLIQAIKGK